MICPYFTKCGGCSCLDVPYEKQLEEKQAHLVDAITAIEPEIKIENPVSGPQFGYRSRARFRYSKEGLSFFEEKSNTPVVIKSCPVLDDQLNKFIANPPKYNVWELEDGQLSCISSDKKVVCNDDMGWVTVGDKKLPVSGDVFFQSNRILLPQLIGYVKQNVEGPDVMDLYSGVGTFSAFLEDDYNVTAVEINKKCLSLAKQHLKKTEFFTSPVERWKSKKRNVDTVIVDPPRVGLDRSVPQMISSWQPKKIIYVSCYLNTMLRDLERFKNLGYQLLSAKLFDFYPNTSHVETVVLLSNLNSREKNHVSVDVDMDEYRRIKDK